jgi:uncharacterized protein (DUF2252 family)
MDALHDGPVPGLAAPESAHEDAAALPTLGASTSHILVTPTNEKAPDTPHVRGLMQGRNYTAIFSQCDGYSKRFATLQAHMALAGFSLTRATDGYYVVARWNQTHNLETLEQVDLFRRRVAP